MKTLFVVCLIISFAGCISRPRENTRKDLREDQVEVQQQESDLKPQRDFVGDVVRIPFSNESGVLHVQANLNGSPLKFIFDSGASDVTISVTEASYLLKNDYLGKDDFTGQQNYMDANGDVNVGVTFLISEMKIGSALLKNVKASVVNSRTASNLLGQSALERFGKVSMDYVSNEIILEPK